MTLNTALPCLVSAIFFYASAGYYEKFRESLVADKDDAQAKASNCQFEGSDSVGDYGYFSNTRRVKGAHNSTEGGSYRFVRRQTFGVYEIKGREPANSENVLKGRPLLSNTVDGEIDQNVNDAEQ